VDYGWKFNQIARNGHGLFRRSLDQPEIGGITETIGLLRAVEMVDYSAESFIVLGTTS
jgi:hypothetical protein